MLRFLDAIGRPLARLAVMALMLAVTWFFIRFGDAMAAGLYRWANGDGVDLNGMAALLGGASALLGVIIPFIVSLFRDRRIERVEQIRAGVPPAPPFGQAPAAPSQPSLPADDTLGPRPGENWQ